MRNARRLGIEAIFSGAETVQLGFDGGASERVNLFREERDQFLSGVPARRVLSVLLPSPEGHWTLSLSSHVGCPKWLDCTYLEACIDLVHGVDQRRTETERARPRSPRDHRRLREEPSGRERSGRGGRGRRAEVGPYSGVDLDEDFARRSQDLEVVEFERLARERENSAVSLTI